MNQSLYQPSRFNTNEYDAIDSYSFYSYIIKIQKTSFGDVIKYSVKYDPLTYKNLKYFPEYENEVKSILEKYVLKNRDFCSFEELYTHLTDIADEKFEWPKHLLIPIFSRILNLEKIIPLLIDDQVDEIYLDSSNKTIYIDHTKYGRCNTTIKLTKDEIESFVHRVALENDFTLNQSNPTMKSDFVSSLFHTRVTVDIPPLIIEDIHIDIRKFHSNSLRIPDLINNGSLSLIQAKFLVLLIRSQVSISIIGPPNSGKTTLQNALIEFIPPHYRLLSVEDVLEISNNRKGNIVRFRLGYDPHESVIFSKSLEIQKILHRSPDFINLGELSLKSHFTAFLNVLSVGVPSIQTIHGKNPEYLFGRLKDIYDIPLELLKTSFPHIFVELNVSWDGKKKKRQIISIAELLDNGKVLPLSENQLTSFFSHKNELTEINTINFLLERGLLNLNEYNDDFFDFSLKNFMKGEKG